MFEPEQFELTAGAPAKVRGRSIMPLNDTPDVRAWSASFDQEPVGTHSAWRAPEFRRLAS